MSPALIRPGPGGARVQVVIVSPVLADANNGNWRTAQRWQRFLSPVADVRIVTAWPDARAIGDDVMIALHARRSAGAVAAWHAARGSRGLAVVLTGTDLHRDIHDSPLAIASLDHAQALVVLHERGIAALPAGVQGKARVILQSASGRQPVVKTPRHLNVLVVGHLRSEKSPETVFAAARMLRDRPDIRFRHIGQALEPLLAEQAIACGRDCPAYRWLGGLPHDRVRRAIQRAHVLLHSSRMEGGANVVIEAITSGTPVLASAVDGNIGLLGEDYPGYFPWGDVAAVAGLLKQVRREQAADDGLLARLTARALARAPRFLPARERQDFRQLVADLA